MVGILFQTCTPLAIGGEVLTILTIRNTLCDKVEG